MPAEDKLHAIALKTGDPHHQIHSLEAELLKHPQVEMPVEHAFCAGLYARTQRIPGGTVLTGAIHRHASFFVLREGDLAVTTSDGPRFLKVGEMLITQAGTKRAGVAITDCVVTTFHPNPTNETDPHALWDLFTVPAPALQLCQDPQEMLQ